jgi:phosphatidylinositol alpha-mannosyltransferase
MKYAKRAPQSTSRFDAKSGASSSGLARKRAGAVLKIGFVFDDTLDSYDGVAQNVKIFGKWMSTNGHDVRYLVGETKMLQWAGGKVYSLSKNQRVTFNGNQARIPYPANKKNIKKVLEEEKFDILHVQMPHSPFMAQKVVNAAGDRVAIVGTFHVAPSGVLASAGGHFLKLMYGRGLKRFDKFLGVSVAAGHYAKSAFGVETGIMPNPIELNKFLLPNKKIKMDKNNIVFLGRLVKRKGAKELIEAFNILAQYNPDATLTIAGDGPEREDLENLVGRYKLDERVKFLGFIEEQDKANLLAGSSIACFPSLYGESFGVSLLEGMASSPGIVLGGDNPGYRTILGARPQMLVDAKNSLAFAGKLSELLDNKEIRKELNAWQKNEVKKYDINEVGPKLEKVYQDVIANHRDKGHN